MNLHQRANAQAKALTNTLNDSFRLLSDSGLLTGNGTTKDLVSLVCEISRKSFVAGIETQSDVLQEEFAEMEARAMQLECHLNGTASARRN